MASFQALMALSATQTRESQSAVQTALLERQRKEREKRQQQEAEDKKRQEMEKQIRLRHFENQKREQERLQRQEEAKRAKAAEQQRREEEQRDALRYGPKKAKAVSESAKSNWPSSSSQSQAREDVRKRRLPVDDDDDSAPGDFEFLTREEKRQRKQMLEQRRLFNTSKRTSNASSYSKAGRRLPGGAVDVMTTQQTPEAHSGQTAKERILAQGNTLTKLNTVKRDTRTIDEIMQDRAKDKETKILAGDEAREFDDWFGSSKKKETVKTSGTRPNASAPASGANTPGSQGSNFGYGSTPVSATSHFKKVNGATKPSPLKIGSKSAGPSSAGPKSAGSASRSGSSEKNLDKYASSKPSNVQNRIPKQSNAPAARSTGFYMKKRPRSTSRSESPPPSKKRAVSPDLSEDISSTIWKMFGRDRTAYVGMDVLSDDEDMEADATLLEREEQQSARIAKREEQAALEDERRHEEEKRRRRKEKEALAKRG